MGKATHIPIDGPGADIDFCVWSAKWSGRILRTIFRIEIKKDAFDHVELDKPGIWVAPHNNGFWGIIDILVTLYCWYGILKQRRPLAMMSEARVLEVPLIGNICRRIGFKVASVKAAENCLTQGEWIILPPGGNTDMMRSVWHRNQTRHYKCKYKNGKFEIKPQTWIVHAAAPLSINAYPMCATGAHESTPILWESKFILKYSGLIKLRKDSYWPGFPVSLNHFINLFVFWLTGWMQYPLAWVAFIFTNIAIDLFYSYPIFFNKVRVGSGKAVKLSYSRDDLTLKERKEENLTLLRQLNQNVNECLDKMDDERPIMRHLPKFKPKVDF